MWKQFSVMHENIVSKYYLKNNKKCSKTSFKILFSVRCFIGSSFETIIFHFSVVIIGFYTKNSWRKRYSNSISNLKKKFWGWRMALHRIGESFFFYFQYSANAVLFNIKVEIGHVKRDTRKENTRETRELYFSCGHTKKMCCLGALWAFFFLLLWQRWCRGQHFFHMKFHIMEKVR